VGQFWMEITALNGSDFDGTQQDKILPYAAGVIFLTQWVALVKFFLFPDY